jgi:hypothetical protein
MQNPESAVLCEVSTSQKYKALPKRDNVQSSSTLYHATLGLRVMKKNKSNSSSSLQIFGLEG